MRTTVQIGEALLARAMSVLGKETKNDGVEETLRRVVVHAERRVP